MLLTINAIIYVLILIIILVDLSQAPNVSLKKIAENIKKGGLPIKFKIKKFYLQINKKHKPKALSKREI